MKTLAPLLLQIFDHLVRIFQLVRHPRRSGFSFRLPQLFLTPASSATLKTVRNLSASRRSNLATSKSSHSPHADSRSLGLKLSILSGESRLVRKIAAEGSLFPSRSPLPHPVRLPPNPPTKPQLFDILDIGRIRTTCEREK